MTHTSHNFQENTEKAEVKTKIVMVLTAIMMIVEIVAGALFNSMALLADGWHMSTHMCAFIIAVIAYSFARKNQCNKNFSFGTGKIGVLGGFASSILLLVVAGTMINESIARLFNPSEIQFEDALLVAIAGFGVNIVSAFILKDSGHLPHDSGHAHHHDKNLKAAYLHVITDAFTSITAIIALLVGYFAGIAWIDSVMGLLGSVIIIIWAIGIIMETAVILVDYMPKSCDLEQEITKAFRGIENTKINDLHIWQVAADKYATIISIEAKKPKKLQEYYDLVKMHDELVHVSIQVCD